MAIPSQIAQNTRQFTVITETPPMERDYKLDCLLTMPRHELEEFSLRILGRMIPQESMDELFTFEAEETENEDRLRSAQFDALLRMNAVALGEIPFAFSETEQARQNINRMSRLLLWHFYAISFHLEEAVSLEQHCAEVEKILLDLPANTFGWVNTLTELLHTYAKLSEENTQHQNDQ